MLNRLGPVLNSKPKTLMIMIGTNDLAHDIDTDISVSNYKAIVKKITNESASTLLVIQSVPPVNNLLYGSIIKNEDVDELNQEIEKIAKDNNFEFLDVNK